MHMCIALVWIAFLEESYIFYSITLISVGTCTCDFQTVCLEDNKCGYLHVPPIITDVILACGGF